MDQRGNPIRKIPFYMVTGFLGSGKTTFLKNILNRFSDTMRIGIIQNEFAPGAVDGTELKSTGRSFEILEVNNGSVFCVCLLGSFVKSLSDFVEIHQPDMIFMEASGLSDPIAVAEMLQGEKLTDQVYLAHIWCILDAANFDKLSKRLPRIQHQVRVADTVVINKSDLVSTNHEEISKWIKYLNPFASIETTSYCDIIIEQGLSEEDSYPVAMRKNEGFFPLAGGGRPDFGAYVIKTTNGISLINLEAFMHEVAPGSLRIKGFVRLDNNQMMAVQSCFGDIKMESLSNYSGPTELIGIGPDINHINFGRRFRNYQNAK